MRSLDLYCLNSDPTREESCLDNIITNMNKDNINCKVLEPHLSDHSGVYANFYFKDCTAKVKKASLEYIWKRNLKPWNLLQLKQNLGAVDWEKMYNLLCIDESFNYFISVLKNYLEEFCPIKLIKITNTKKVNKNWFTPELKMARDRLVFLYDLFKQSKGSSNEMKYKDTYKKAKKAYNVLIIESKKKSNESYIQNSQNMCKAAWTVIKDEISIGSKKNVLQPPLDPETFNDYFVNVAPKISNKLNNVPDNCDMAINYVNSFISKCNYVNINFKWKYINVQDVIKVVNSLNNSYSEDYHGFSNKVVKEIIFSVVYPLTFLYNKMLHDGTFPKILKVTKVIPVYKKGDRFNTSSYRPISLVPIFSKVFESIVKDQIYSYFVQNHFICKEQFGFIPGLSTIKAVQKVVSQILLNFENKSTTSAILIDLSKAFDSVSHELLLRKLYSYGIRSKELDLLKSYLSGRQQIVSVNNKNSGFKTVQQGVPQGSVLGPLLFIVAINDFSNSVPCSSVLYADDTTLLSSNKDLDNLLQLENQAVRLANEWFRTNLLSVNEGKTENIMFSLSNSISTDSKKSVNLLGIHLDTKLTWEAHIGQLCTKLSRVVYLIRKLRNCVSKEMLVTAYYAFFNSHLIYGITLWGNSSHSKRVFLWQKKVLRGMKNVCDRVSCVSIFKEYRIMTFPSLYIYFCLLNVKENLDSFNCRYDLHKYSTRGKYMLENASCRLEKTKCSFLIMRITLFNKLPKQAWDVTFKRFKKVINKWLIDRVFYSVNEYLACDTSDLKF